MKKLLLLSLFIFIIFGLYKCNQWVSQEPETKIVHQYEIIYENGDTEMIRFFYYAKLNDKGCVVANTRNGATVSSRCGVRKLQFIKRLEIPNPKFEKE